MQILITGGTGFLGRHLVAQLLAEGHRVAVVSRQESSEVRRLLSHNIKPVKSLSAVNPSVAYDVLINLAGAGIMDQRWSHYRKRVLLDSRVQLTSELVDLIERMENKPKRLISASAVSFYGLLEEPFLCNESVHAGSDFAASLCSRWEQVACRAESLGVDVFRTRIGVVLHPDGGALHRMLPVFHLGLGGPIGTGKQYISWIHINDLINAFIYLLNGEASPGEYNLTAPQPVSNKAFSVELARALKRPAFMKMPAPVLRILVGEASELMIKGQQVIPEKLLNAGFQFKYPTLKSALGDFF